MEIRPITLFEVRRKIETGEPVTFIDARSPENWQQADVTIPECIRVPPDEVEEHLDKIPRDHEIVVYCNTPDQKTSTWVARALMDKGWENVHPLEGGLETWMKGGYAAEPKN